MKTQTELTIVGLIVAAVLATTAVPCRANLSDIIRDFPCLNFWWLWGAGGDDDVSGAN